MHRLETWTTNQVCDWLEACGIEGMNQDIVDLFKRNCVNGNALKHYQLEELRGDFPQVPSGIRKNIWVLKEQSVNSTSQTQTAIKEHNQIQRHEEQYLDITADLEMDKSSEKSISKTHSAIEMDTNTEKTLSETHSAMSEIFRPFDHCVDLNFKYNKHSIFPHTDKRPGDLLQPVRHYVEIDLNSTKKTSNALYFATELLAFVCACLNNRSNGTIFFGVRKTGEILGTQLENNNRVELFDNTINNILRQGFHDEAQIVVFNCVRPAKFVPIVSIKDGEKDNYVIEIDVIPKWEICEEEEFCVKLPFKKGRKKLFGKSEYFHFTDGKPRPMSRNELIDYIKSKGKLSTMRKNREKEMRRPSVDEELGQKLIDLLELDNDSDVYPILVMNSLGSDCDIATLKKSFSFIKDIPWSAVFDFDEKGILQKYLEGTEGLIARIMPTPEELNNRSKENQQNPDKLKTLQEEIKSSSYLPWIFSNGFQPMHKAYSSLFEWKRHVNEGFKEAVRFFADEIPDGRAIVVFMLLSKDYEIMLEAADELCSKFQDQWMLVADTNNVAMPWIDQMQCRGISGKDTILDHSVVGLPWHHLQNIIHELKGPAISDICKLPTSYGIFFPLPDREKNGFSDLEILSAKECEHAAVRSRSELDEYREKVENQFYHGAEVSWWNFWFDDSVLRRCKLSTLREKVSSSLNTLYPKDVVGIVNMYHQAGSGGTTTAKNVLWDLRGKYRCAIVKNINYEKTCDQILELRSTRDTNPKPVLLLMDNLDEEKVSMLIAQLEERGRRITRESETDHVVCVCLILTKYSKPPKNRNRNNRLILENILTVRELSWFQRRYKQLKYNHLTFKGADPKFLISFNILKENFNEKFMIRTVMEYTSKLNIKEKHLLKYIALINHFDACMQPVPSSAFDTFMIDNPFATCRVRYGLKANQNRWENNLSANIKILLNYSSTKGMKAFQIIHPQLSRHILNTLMTETDTTSSLALELLSNDELFCFQSGARDQLMNIIQGLVTLRQRGTDGNYVNKFSPLITDILDTENTEQASKVMLKCYEMTKHPFVVQHLARLCISEKNWTSAEEYAQKAVDARPQHPHVLDTLAQVYKEQIKETYDKYLNNKQVITLEEGLRLVQWAFKAIDTFRAEQNVVETDSASYMTDNSGFHGELGTIILLLKSLALLDPFTKNTQKMRAFLAETDFVPEELADWNDIDDHNLIWRLKQLQYDAKHVFLHLKDEQIQLRENFVDGIAMVRSFRPDFIPNCKYDLDRFFGETTTNVPKGMTAEQQCQYRRRRLFTLGGNILSSIFQRDKQDKEDVEKLDEETLQEMKSIALLNLECTHRNHTADDLQFIISINLALLSLNHDHYIYEINFKEMANWSKELYQLRSKQKTKQLEPYLFYVLLNWPRKMFSQCEAPNKIRDALRHWKDTYHEKYPRQQEVRKQIRKKDNITYFFAYGSDLASFMTKGQLEIGALHEIEFWKNPQILKCIQQFNGTLTKEGNEVLVNVEYGEGHNDTISIPTAYPIKKSDWWNKTVYFVIGFRCSIRLHHGVQNMTQYPYLVCNQLKTRK